MAGSEQRIDKWLFFARVVKSRSLAQKLALSGQVRVNREKIVQASRLVRPGDVLTIGSARGIRVLKVLDPGVRRGPASEAVRLYEDLSLARTKPDGPADGPASPGADLAQPRHPNSSPPEDFLDE